MCIYNTIRIYFFCILSKLFKHQTLFKQADLDFSTYKDLSPERCLASDTTFSELTVVFILEMSVGKFRKIETAEAIYRKEKKFCEQPTK